MRQTESYGQSSGNGRDFAVKGASSTAAGQASGSWVAFAWWWKHQSGRTAV